MKKIRTFLFVPLCAFMTIFFVRCSNDDKNNVVLPTLVKEWTNIPLSAKFEVPAPAGRSETGTATLQLYSDNSFKYTATVTNLTAGDAITAGHIHAGDPGTSGGIILDLTPVFTGGSASGTVNITDAAVVDSIKNGSTYINFHTTQVGSGLIRGQLDKTIDFAMDIPMTGAAEAPNPVTTTATGTAYLRLTSDNLLFSKIVVENLEGNDTLTAAHIHPGAVGVAGGVIIPLAAGAADFGVLKVIPLDAALADSVKNAAIYVNAHSKRHGSGIIRGQIR